MLQALDRWLPGTHTSGADAGLFELLWLPEEIDESLLLRVAGEHGVGVEGLSLHRFTPGGPPGLVLGYGNLAEPAIEQGVRLLGEAFAEVRGTA